MKLTVLSNYKTMIRVEFLNRSQINTKKTIISKIRYV